MSSYAYDVSNCCFELGYKVLYRFIFVTSGASAPDAESGYNVVLIGTVGSNDMYIEFRMTT
jgi:hypothetical protein